MITGKSNGIGSMISARSSESLGQHRPRDVGGAGDTAHRDGIDAWEDVGDDRLAGGGRQIARGATVLSRAPVCAPGQARAGAQNW